MMKVMVTSEFKATKYKAIFPRAYSDGTICRRGQVYVLLSHPYAKTLVLSEDDYNIACLLNEVNAYYTGDSSWAGPM